MFITFEGCEGVGKSTQLRFVKEYLKETDQSALFVREPGGTDISEQIRTVILNPDNTAMDDVTEALLYAAARTQLVHEVIRPALSRGELVICDRFVDSSVAYQGYARGLGADFVWKINQPALDGCMPDYTVFFDLKPSESFRTVKTNDRIEQEKAEFHEKVYLGFKATAEKDPERYILIRPDQDKTVTRDRILNELRKRGCIK